MSADKQHVAPMSLGKMLRKQQNNSVAHTLVSRTKRLLYLQIKGSKTTNTLSQSDDQSGTFFANGFVNDLRHKYSVYC